MKNLAAGVVYGFLLISPLGLNAQNNYSNQLVVYGHERQLCPADNATGTTAPGTGSRLIAEVSGRFNAGNVWAPDSTVYTYTGTRGGDYEGNTSPFPLKYDVAITYAADPATLVYSRSVKKIQTFNGADQVTSFTEQDWSGSGWIDNDRTLHTYNANGLNDTITGQLYNAAEGTWVNVYRIAFVYNGRNQILSAKYDTWNTRTESYDPTELSLYTYGPNMLTYLIQLYDAATGTYANSTRYLHYFNSSMVETAEVHQNYNTSGEWINSDSTTMLYNPKTLSTESDIYNWTVSDNKMMAYNAKTFSTESNVFTMASSTLSWKKYGHYLITSNPAGKAVTSLQENWNTTTNAYTGVAKDALTYNASNQRTTLITHDLPSGAPASKARYYYELYTTGAGNVAGNDNARLEVYPVPAQESVNIAMSLSSPQKISGAVSDAAGRILQEWQEDAGSDYRKQLSVTALPAGVYWLQVTTGNSQVRRSFSVVH